MVSFIHIRLSIVFILLGTVGASRPLAAADASAPIGVMTLDSGGTVPGEFRPSEAREIIRWQGTSFTSPFEFESAAVSSIQFPAADPPVKPQGEFALELARGDIITGRFSGWSEEAVTFDSTHFGPVTIRPGAIRRLYRIDENPMLVFPNLSGLSDWETTSGEWREDGAQIWTESDGAVLTGDFGVPDRAIVEFELSWKKTPNFVFAIGVAPNFPDDRRHGWRFEAWNLVLAAVREQNDLADVDHVQDLSKETGQVHLLAYLDQSAGEMHVFRPDGTPAGRIAVRTAPPDRKQEPGKGSGRGIRLINRHGDIRLERLRIAQWNGVLPTATGDATTRFELTTAPGETRSGEIVGLDRDAGHFIVRDGEDERTISINEIAAAEFSPPAGSSSADTSALLQDNTRISGRIQKIETGELIIASPYIDEPLRVPLSNLRSMTFSTTGDSQGEDEPAGRRGQLEIGGHKLSGWLAAGTESPEAQCFVWHPDGSRTGSPLKPDVSGRVVYRERKPQSDAQSEAERRAQKMRELAVQRRQAAQPQPNFFARLFLKKADEPPRKARVVGVAAPQNLHLRSGDVIACSVKSIDESGITIETSVLENRVVPHNLIKAIEMDGKASPPDLQEAKKQRLLTLPRMQAASPPTHLLCSHNGDFLRCRLIALTENKLRIEVQLEEIEIPRDRVSQIIWFHPDELETEGDAAAADEETPRSDFRNLAQVLQRGGKRVTFDPEEVDGETISGVSEVVGPCRFPLDEIEQLLFGEEIQSAAAELVYHQWKMHPAVLPRVAQDLGDGPADSGAVSPLVGKPAPDFDLELLTGGRFKLSDHKGQIIVLDFWATWCGPCMQTMPLLEEAAANYDPSDVRFVSVNLEERAEHVKGVLERHELNVTVALDIDGVAARRYEANAIPQLVIVDRDGTIARLYVGGGSNVIGQLKSSLDELLTQ